VKEEWEEKERRRKENKDKEKDAEEKDQDKQGNEVGGGKKAEDSQEKKPEIKKVPPTWSPSLSGQSTPASRPTHERYILHRGIFALRVADYRRRRQAAQAKDLAPRLPGAPRSTLS